MKTKIVTFSYGTVKDASLKVPAESYSVYSLCSLIRESYLDYAFRSGSGLMSDACLTSSIGHDNFMAGALGGYETRLTPEVFALVKDSINSELQMALAVARYREPNATSSDIYMRASKNDALSEENRDFLSQMAVHFKAA